MQNIGSEHANVYQRDTGCKEETTTKRRGVTTAREYGNDNLSKETCPTGAKNKDFCTFSNTNFASNSCHVNCRSANSKSSDNLSNAGVTAPPGSSITFSGPTLPKNREAFSKPHKFSLPHNNSGGENVTSEEENYGGGISYPLATVGHPAHYATICKGSSISHNADRIPRNSCNYRIQRGLSSHELLARNSQDDREMCSRADPSSRGGNKNDNCVGEEKEQQQMQFGSLNRTSHRQDNRVKFSQNNDSNPVIDSFCQAKKCGDGVRSRNSGGKCKSPSANFKTNCNEQTNNPAKSVSPLPSVVDLPKVTRDSHKYYTLKVNSARQNSESFV